MTALTRAPQNTNYLQPTKFLLTFDRISSAQYFCQEANIPGISQGSVTINTPTLDYQIAGQKLTYNPFNVTFTVDEEAQGYRDLHAWFRSFASPSMDERNLLSKMQTVDKPQSKIGKVRNYDNAILTVLSALNNPLLRVQFYNVYPTSLSDIQFSTKDSADTILTATAGFAFEYYEFMPL
jgi:hypothetical protein